MPMPEDEKEPVAEADSDAVERREFLTKSLAIATGGVVIGIPLATGLVTFLSPLTRVGEGGLKVRLASVTDLPEDGTPKRYDVIAERSDAWTKYAKKPLGSVYLRKLEDGEIVAFNSICPHAGCSVGYQDEKNGFYCPCHDSLFGLDGGIVGKSPSPRALDTLEIDQEKLAEGEIWVTFVNFKTGIEGKEEIS